MNNIKTLGLLVVSAMALTAFAGTTAASATSLFTMGGAGQPFTTTTLSGPTFEIEGSKVECEEETLTGETEGVATESLTLSPSYKKCKAFGFANATVTAGTCKFTFKSSTDGAGMATVNLYNCENATKGIQIDVNVPFITRIIVDIPHQSMSSAVSYTNTTPTGTTMSVDLNMTATGLMNDVTTCTGPCPLQVGTNSTGTYFKVKRVTPSGGITWSA